MRQRMLFPDTYTAVHPDEVAPGNHPRVLLHGNRPVGTVRIDVDGEVVQLRLVTIVETCQGRGFGRELVSLAEEFARNQGCRMVRVRASDESLGFWKKCGYTCVPLGDLRDLEKSFERDVLKTEI